MASTTAQVVIEVRGTRVFHAKLFGFELAVVGALGLLTLGRYRVRWIHWRFLCDKASHG